VAGDSEGGGQAWQQRGDGTPGEGGKDGSVWQWETENRVELWNSRQWETFEEGKTVRVQHRYFVAPLLLSSKIRGMGPTETNFKVALQGKLRPGVSQLTER